MTTLREAAQQALEWANNHGEIVFAGGGWKAVDGMNSWTQALRAALAQPVVDWESKWADEFARRGHEVAALERQIAVLERAAQQALEALEGCVKALDALHAPGDSIYTRASDLADRAEIALRAALVQQEQEPVAWRFERLKAEKAELLEALKMAMPTLERLKFEADCSYGRNFVKTRAETARRNYEVARAAITKAEGEKT